MFKNRLDATFRALARQQRRALIGYVAAGYPSFSTQSRMIPSFERAGMDVLEIGIPFSDPIADGPTVQRASQASLNQGTRLDGIFRWTKTLSRTVRMPLVLMTYLNPVMAYGVDRFFRAARASGATGVIIPDVTPEESGIVRKRANTERLHLIHLISPTTPPERQRWIARHTGGFLYAVSVAGVTGARRRFTPETLGWLKTLKARTTKPVCVGFGISGPAQVRAVRPFVDGVIVGSALIDRMRRGGRNTGAAQNFVKHLAKECVYGGRKNDSR